MRVAGEVKLYSSAEQWSIHQGNSAGQKESNELPRPSGVFKVNPNKADELKVVLWMAAQRQRITGRWHAFIRRNSVVILSPEPVPVRSSR